MAKVEAGKLTITLPGSPDAVITGVDYLTWGAQKRIGSASQKETAQGGLSTDLNLMFDALVVEYSKHPETRGHIHDHRGALIPFAPDVIDEHAHREDVALLALELGRQFYPEIFGHPIDESADPNEETAPTEETEPEQKPKPVRTRR